MKARASIFWLLGLSFSSIGWGNIPGDKRTILTSGEKVYPIRYQLGQSTVLYFGLRPETVICGNKNYFNIEKIKDGITIQPLSNFSTNLTVMAQGRRYLFYLTPANGLKPDGFVEAKWIPSNQVREIRPLARESATVTRELAQRTRIAGQIELTISRERSSEKGKRRIFEIELKNLGRNDILLKSLEIVASLNGSPIERQVLVWEIDTLKVSSLVRGRLIVSGHGIKPLSFVVGYLGRSTKIILNGRAN